FPKEVNMQSNGAVANAAKQWTVMVYMSSDNALGSDCVWALTEMQNSNLDKQNLAVVAQFDPPASGIGTIQYDFTLDKKEMPGTSHGRLEVARQKLSAPLEDGGAT